MNRRERRLQKQLTEGKATNRHLDIYSELYNKALDRFQWENLPNDLESFQLEDMLISKGLLCGIEINNEIHILPCWGNGSVDFYNRQKSYIINTFNGHSFTRDRKDIALLRNNYNEDSDIEVLQYFAKTLSDIEMTCEVNLFQQNIPKVFNGDQDSILSLKNMFQELKEFKLALFTRKGNNILADLDVVDSSAPYLLDKLMQYEHEVLNKVLTYLGIDNNNVNKRERLVTAEVSSNNENIESLVDLMLKCRQDFCTKCNAMFGTNIKVSKKENDYGSSITDDSGTIE